MIVPARGGVHGGDRHQSADNTETADNSVSGVGNAFHRDCEEDKASKNSGAH